MILTQLILTAAATPAPAPLDHPPVEIVPLTGEVVGGGWLDGDHDGVDDLAYATRASPVLKVFTQGSAVTPVEVALPTDAGTVRDVVIGHEADGTTFLVVSFEETGDVYRMVHATWTPAGFVVDWAQDGATDPQLAGDVDGDGFVDLWTWSIQKSLWLSGSGTGVPLPSDVAHGRQLWNVQAVGDVDQDLYDDLLLSFWEYADGTFGYPQMVGHAALYRGSPDGLAAVPLWELSTDDMPVEGLFVGAAAVGLGDGVIALSLSDQDWKFCDGDDWIALVHDADTEAPRVVQVVDVPFDDDCQPNRLARDTAPNGMPAVVAWSDQGAHWLKLDLSRGELPDLPNAAWIPDESLWWADAFATAPLSLLVFDGYGSSAAVWAPLHVGPEPEPPPADPPTETGPPPEVDQQLVVVSTPEGTTCWCGVVPAAGGAWMTLASMAAVRARTRVRAGRSTR